MGTKRARDALIRQWSLVEHLSTRKRGATIAQLCEHTGASRPTTYRDIGTLRDAGVPVESAYVNGEKRYSLWGKTLPPLGPTALQIAALRLARRALSGLEGTSALRELDGILAGYARASGASEVVTFAKQRVVAPELVRKLSSAIQSQRLTRIRYRSAAAREHDWRAVDPLGLRYAGGHMYFVAYDHKRKVAVPFKLDRLSAVQVLPEKARSHHEVDVEALFAKSAKVWLGPTVDVVVRLSTQVARFAREYPLPEQALEDAPGEAVLVHARVAGIAEAMRWVLSWGKEAEALEPAELREAVAVELRRAAAQYAASGTTKASELEAFARLGASRAE